jgi:hypothetical protein
MAGSFILVTEVQKRRMAHTFNILVNHQFEACPLTNNHYKPIAPPDFSSRSLTFLDIIVIVPNTPDQLFIYIINMH